MARYWSIFVQMKKTFLFILIAFSLSAVAQNGPQATFDQKHKLINDGVEGIPVSTYFAFTNTGKADLKLHKVKTTCGCTVAEWPKGLIAPGQRDSILVHFNTTDRVGLNAKGVNIESNAGEINLILEVMVKINPDPSSRPTLQPIFKEDHSGHSH